jgi:acyl carrier protein
MLDRQDRTPRGRLLGLVAEIVGEPSRTIPPEARLTDLGMTSIKMVNLMLAVEAEFAVTIPQGDITPDNFRSVATIEALLQRLAQVAP